MLGMPGMRVSRLRLRQGGLNVIGIELEEAILLLAAHAKPVERTESVPLLAGVGKILAEDAAAPFDHPPFDRSPLDGYAFRAADSGGASANAPASLMIVGEVCAGQVYAGEVQPGQAVRVMTGAPIPRGCDCVIRQEWVEADARTLWVRQALRPHENYCFRGEDIKRGALLARRGDVLSAAHIGALASMGRASILVYGRPRVAICSTGDELTEVGRTLTDGKIYNSNLYVLSGRLKELGFDPLVLGIAEDSADAVAALIAKWADQVDLFLTTGGVSVGKKDILHEVIARLGAKRLFWRVNMKPGTPLLAYLYGEALCVGLSGNPFAALATFELLVRPALARAARDPRVAYRRVQAVLQDDFPKRSAGRRFIRAKLRGEKVYLPAENHASGSLFSAVGCDAMIDIPKGTPELKAGQIVEVVQL